MRINRNRGRMRVGIVGGGMSGQHFEAGAMRIPVSPMQQIVFDLCGFLNERSAPQRKLSLIPYILQHVAGNRVFVNGRRAQDGRTMTYQYAVDHPDRLGYDLPDEDFDTGFAQLVKFDCYSLRSYLHEVAGWSNARISYVEEMTSQTNQFRYGLVDAVIQGLNFSASQWRTIDNGMDRLPAACAELIGYDRIVNGARVREIRRLADGRVACVFRKSPGADAESVEVFDKVVIAVPPTALRMIRTPDWGHEKHHATRSLTFEPLYKLGLRFSTRFWEQVDPPSRGGQSVTDLPSRWIVYPSYGIGEHGPGVLTVYAWAGDATSLLSASPEERLRVTLRDIRDVYRGEVDVQGLFMESFEAVWPSLWSGGDAMFLPGQFSREFEIARRPEGNVYFAGEHLSPPHTWIAGALDSALHACRQLLGRPALQALAPSAFA